MLITASKQLWFLLNARERRQAIVLLMAMLVGAVLEIVGMTAIPAFISAIVKPELLMKVPGVSQLASAWQLDTPARIIGVLAIILAGIFAFKSIYLAILTYGQNRFLFDKLRRFTVELYRIYLSSPYTFHLARNSAELINYVNTETYQMFVSFILPYIIFLTEAIVIVLVAIVLAALEPVASLSAVTILLLVTAIYYRLIRRKIADLGTQRQFHSSKMVQWVNQGLSGIKEIKVAGEEDFFAYNFDWHTEGYVIATRVATTLEVLPRLMLETVAVMAIMAAIAIGFAQGKTSVEVLNSISLFAIASFRLLPAVNRAIGSLTSMRYHASCLQVIYQDYRSLQATAPTGDLTFIDRPAPSVELTLDLALEFKNITYTYPGSDRPSIHDLSLVIPQGKRVGLVGASGAGKTTLVDLLLGLLVPDKGEILADGIEIDRYPQQWQQLVGYIPQHIYLCDDTIAANIAFGHFPEHINFPRLDNVLRAVKMYDFVRDLPDGSGTMVGESGVRLSGGQRQRIGIARAMYRNPQLLVMDEATSALDNQTERDVSEAIDRLSHNKTVITIAHRLTTVKNCDIIYVMEGGQIVDWGTYTELLANSPKFQKLALVATND